MQKQSFNSFDLSKSRQYRIPQTVDVKSAAETEGQTEATIQPPNLEEHKLGSLTNIEMADLEPSHFVYKPRPKTRDHARKTALFSVHFSRNSGMPRDPNAIILSQDGALAQS